MPFARRPDSWIILSRPATPRNRAATTDTCSDDSLSEFTSETPRQAIDASNVSLAEGAGRNDVTLSPTRIQNPTVDLHAATHLRTGLHTFERHALRLVASLATYVRRPRPRSTWATSVSLWIGRVRNLRRPATSTTLSSFAGGAATGVLVMWFVGVQPPPTVMPSTTHAVTPETTLAPPDLPASSPNVQPAAERMSASSTSRPSSLVSAISRPVGTSGRRIGDVHQAVRPSRAASAPPARRRNAAGTTSASYRGSLAFESAPQGSRVFINGAFVGSTPLVLENLAVGSRAIRIEADGYQRWSASTRVVANQRTRVSATLAHAVR
jgi:hypothetical protein